MKKKVIIYTNSLKEFLLLFKKDETLNNLTLGDTWHPSSGYVDESILGGKRKVHELSAFDYDFKGLVHFKANINSMEINFIDKSRDNNNPLKYSEKYAITGNNKDLQILINKVTELNTYEPGKYFIEKIYTNQS